MNIYKCKKCDESFTTIGLLGSHNRWIHNKTNISKKEIECPKCGHILKGNLKAHMEKCDGQGTKKSKKKNSKFKGLGKNWLKGKKYNEIYSDEKCTEIIQKLRINCQHAHTDETKLKLSNIIKERYKNGWECKCGRAPKIQYESLIAGNIKIDGSWELKVAQYLDKIKVSWIRNKKRFDYVNEKNTISTYCPDFFVYDWNTYIEVKGYQTDKDLLKWAQFVEPLIVWKKKELKELNII